MAPAHFLGVLHNPLIVTKAGLAFTPTMFQFGATEGGVRATISASTGIFRRLAVDRTVKEIWVQRT